MSERTQSIEGVEVPRFLYGTAWKEDETQRLTQLALRQGFRGIDTANQRRHYHEAAVGRAIAAAVAAGVVAREDLFLQTKYTFRDGQDHRLPYDPGATLSVQVAQSMASSLEHLGTDQVDSFVLHGPASNSHWTTDDFETWQAMIKERDAGRTRLLGVSNISLPQLQQMARAHAEPPAFVQNRCYAVRGWDREVRAFCRERNIIYQGFSLLTANRQVLGHPTIAALAAEINATPAQLIFAFSRQVGVLPLTGTTKAEHMREDLASLKITLSPDAVRAIEAIAG